MKTNSATLNSWRQTTYEYSRNPQAVPVSLHDRKNKTIPPAAHNLSTLFALGKVLSMITDIIEFLNHHQLHISTPSAIIAGAIARRHMGGYLHPDRWNSRVIFHLVAFLSSWSAVGLVPWLVTFQTVLIGGIVYLQQGHGWAHGMGTEAGPPDQTWKNGTPNPNGGPLNLCIPMFLGNYGVAMMVAGIAWTIGTISMAGLLYALMGLLVWVGYWAVQQAWFPWGWGPFKDRDGTKGHFIDSRTSVGELTLGGLLCGGMPLAAWIVG